MFKVKSLVLLVLVALLASSTLSQVRAQPSSQAAAPTVSVADNKAFGKILVGKDGLTLYNFTEDSLDSSTCVDKCATAWPPLLVDSADKLTVADGIPGEFGTLTRTDKTLQVTYNGQPLYYWFKDKAAGDTTGNRIGRTWWVVPPATVYYQRIAKLGTVLVGPKGQTLYMFVKDAPDVSNCPGKCADAWPPLTVKSADTLVPGVNLPGKFNTIKRDDGSLQVTYNGQPLYYWKDDKVRGDATGEAVGKTWFTVVPETLATSNTKDLGDFLVTPDGMTVYAFANDTAGVSTCTGDCAKLWPAYTISVNDRLGLGTTLKGKLDTIKHDDTSLQVTYNGVPLYLYKTDKKPGDVLGQNVGNVWAVVKP